MYHYYQKTAALTVLVINIQLTVLKVYHNLILSKLDQIGRDIWKSSTEKIKDFIFKY